MKIIVHPIPGKSKRNIFLDNIYLGLEEANSEALSFTVSEQSLSSLVFAPAGNHLIHVHWADMLYGSQYAFKSVFRLVINFCLLRFLKHVRGFKIVWTMHNIQSHDGRFPRIDRLGRKLLAGTADVITIQNENFVARFAAQYPKKQVLFLPYPNYIDSYGPRVEAADDLRAQYGYEANDIVLQSVGMIRPYKKYEVLIGAFNKISATNDKIKLFLIGMAGDAKYVAELQALAAGNKNIQIVTEFVEDADMPRFLAMADYSIFHYDSASMMNSGGVQLSLSYGVPVILPAFLIDTYITEQNALVFTDESELAVMLKELTKSTVSPEVIVASIADRSPHLVRAQLRSLFKTLFS